MEVRKHPSYPLKHAHKFPSSFLIINMSHWEHTPQKKNKYTSKLCRDSGYNFHNFHWYVKTAHVLGIIPYNLEFDTETGGYELSRSRKIFLPFYMAVWFLSIVGRLAVLRHYCSVDTKLIHPTIHYFYLAHSLFCLTRRVLYYKTIMEKFAQIGEMLKIIAHCPLLTATSGSRGPNKIGVISFGTWILIAFTCPVIGFNMFPSWSWSPQMLLKSLVAHGKYTFLLAPSNSTLIENLSEVHAPRWYDVILVIAQFSAALTSEIQCYFIVSAFGISAKTIWLATRNFKERVMMGYYKNMRTISEAFQELSRLADCINQVWQVVSFALILDDILWLATDLDRAFKTTDYYVKFHILYWIVYIGVSSTLSAESARMVSY